MKENGQFLENEEAHAHYQAPPLYGNELSPLY